jgi:hypothetical protein
VSTSDGTAYRGSGTGAEQSPTDRALRGVVRVGAARQGQYQSRGNPSTGNRALCHVLLSPHNFRAETPEDASSPTVEQNLDQFPLPNKCPRFRFPTWHMGAEGSARATRIDRCYAAGSGFAAKSDPIRLSKRTSLLLLAENSILAISRGGQLPNSLAAVSSLDSMT